MMTFDQLKRWFSSRPERLVIFSLGLLFSKGFMAFVQANLMTFLTDFWNSKLKEATTIVNLYEGIKDMLEVNVVVCIDAWLGYRRMLILSSVLYSAIFATVYGFISAKHEWHLRFLISAIFIVIGLLWFLCGFPLYGLSRLQPSRLLTMLRALIVAMRKRHLNYREYSKRLHRGERDDQDQQLTDHLGWLNKAAVKEPAADNRRWRLCSVKEVQEAKILLNIFPMSMTFIVYGMVKSLGNTFFTEQVNSVRGAIPTVVFQMIQELSKPVVKTVFKIVFANRIRRMKRPYTDGVKIGIGMLASIICCAVASSVESKRIKPLSKKGLSHDPNAKTPNLISPFWFVLQFFFLGAMEGLAGDGIQEFFGHYAPDSRRYGLVFTKSVIGFGTILNIAFIAILDYYSESRYDASWLGDSINQSRLDFIYRAYAILALLNFYFYAYVSTWYSYDDIIGRPKEEEEIPFLEVKEEEEPPSGVQQNQQGQGDVELHKTSLR